MNVKFVRINKSYGRYNILSPKKEWRLEVQVVFGNDMFVSYDQTVGDDEPSIYKKLPSEVVLMIAKEKENWISSNSEQEKEQYMLLRKYRDEIDFQFLSQKRTEVEKQLDDIGKQMAIIMSKMRAKKQKPWEGIVT